MKRICVIGIDGISRLGDKAMELIDEAEAVLVSKRLLELTEKQECYGEFKAKVRVMNPISETLDYLKSSTAPVVVIASGDPLFFGIGSKIIEALPDEGVELIPALSSVQLAFSRLGIKWEDAEFVSMHGSVRRKWALEDVPLLARRHDKLAILTGGENTPDKIARFLPGKSTVYVLERLGYKDEKVTEGTPDKIAGGEFGNPNIMVVLAPESSAPAMGLTVDEFRHERSLITKDEVRAVALHKLRLPQKGVFWDIGAGSGSVSIEAKLVSPALRVYAFEKDSSRTEDIRHNARELGAGQINIIEGEAPGAFAGVPSPERIFIGGGGAGLSSIILAAWDAMVSGIIVASTITIESLSEAKAALKALGETPEVTSLSVSRSKDAGGREYMKADNQIFLIKAVKNR